MKFISSYYDSVGGGSTASVEHLGKIFYGYAQLHPEDSGSNFFGCRIAEQRAEIKALKYERNKLKEEAEICRKFVQACKQYKQFNEEDPSAKSMLRQLNVKINKVNELASIIGFKMLKIKQDVVERKAILDKFAKKDNPSE